MKNIDEKLLEKAKELGIEVDDDTTEDELKKLIEEAEKDDKGTKKDKDPEWLEKELKKVIEQRDTLKKDKRRLSRKINELEEKLESAPSKDDFDKLKEELNSLKEFKTAKEKEEEEKMLEQKTELEKAEIRFNKQLEELKSQMESNLKEREEKLSQFEEEIKKREEQINRLRYGKLDAEIMEAAAKFNAYSPAQIVKLTKDMFEYDENLDKFFFYVKDKKGDKIVDELTVEERIKEFLEDDSNANLVRSDVKPGTEHKESVTKTPTETKEVSRLGGVRSSTGEYDPNDPDIKAEADERGLTPEELIDIWKIRDAKKAKIEEKRTQSQS